MIQGEGKEFELLRVPEGDREAWLGLRKKGVGGSEVAAIMGLSPWKSAYQVWADKVVGVTDDLSDKPSVEWGNILEPVVGAHFKELHPDYEVRRVNAVCRSIARPWAQASLDYEIRVPGRGWGVLEIKTAGLRSADRWADGVPVFYQTQVAHYLSVTGRPYAYVAVLIGGQDYREYLIERDEADVRAVDAAVDEFWHGCVEGGKAPDADAMDGPAVFEVHGAPEREYDFEAETPAAVSRYRMACAQFDEAKREKDRWSARLKEQIGEARGIETPEGRMTWRRFERSRFDSKAFDRDHPGMRDQYMTKKMTDGGLRWQDAKKED